MALPTQIEERLKALGVRVSDVEEKFVRGAGPGGQKINKTSSTVWLRHGPTGVEVRCQRERSQAVNREVAWAELVAKLEARVRAARGAPPAFDAEVLLVDRRAGEVLSGQDGRAMALVRLDRIDGDLTADGKPVRVERPEWLAL